VAAGPNPGGHIFLGLKIREETNMIQRTITKAINHENLTEVEMTATMEEVLKGEAPAVQIGAFLTALRMKGETVEEITAAARVVRGTARRIDVSNQVVNIDREEINIDTETILDTCGTGGDGTNTFNISTATALVAAGAGVRVAKHGSRCVSSACGSADVLEQLGVNLDVPPTAVETCIREIGIGFLYEPLFNTSMAHIAEVRRQLGFRTLFNLLGPLTNPAGASIQVLGVYEPGLTEKMAGVLKNLGTREAFVFCGEGTLDEISVCGPTRISHLKDGALKTFELTPEELGLSRAALEAIRGGDARENARIIRRILEGEKGPRRDVVLLNAAAAFVAAGLDVDFKAGIERAAAAIDSRKAQQKLDGLIDFTQTCIHPVRSFGQRS
jgi:anthranilate phosphoribosyltransferase